MCALVTGVQTCALPIYPGGSITTKKVMNAEMKSSSKDQRPSRTASPTRRLAATSVLRNRTAMVIGPTPPGTGVIARTWLIASEEIGRASGGQEGVSTCRCWWSAYDEKKKKTRKK